jgi:cellulose biosynthesis protein BcsQ
MRADDRYRAAIDALLGEVGAWPGAGNAAPAIAIAAHPSGAGASTIALSLAHAACARGTRVLLIDRDRERSGLTSATDDLRRAPLGEPGQIARVARRDAASGGEVLIAPYGGRAPLALDARLKSRFGLILLDCGALASATRALGDCDALLVVVRGPQDARDATAALEGRIGAGLASGIVRIDSAEPLRKSA